MNDILYEQTIKLWGENAQIDMLIEECAELISSINKLRRGRCTQDEVCMEIADVLIMIEQMNLVFNKSMIAEKYLLKKKRLQQRVYDAQKVRQHEND